MSRSIAAIHDLFHAPPRFLRSAQLERDIHDPQALAGYIATPFVAQALQRVADSLRTGGGRRAWRITGDYGVGKSSFALALARLLSDPQGPGVAPLAEALGWTPDGPRLWPVLVTGAREGLIPCLARGIGESLAWRAAIGKKKDLSALQKAAQACEAGGELAGLESLLDRVQQAAAREGAGVLLVIDELGKLLEHAALHPETTDVFALQRLAEKASRSGAHPFLLLGLLHQGVHAYAERLPLSTRQEWEKVAGRFEEIVFDQPLAHTAALVAGALGIRTAQLPKVVQDSARAAAQATAATGWLSGAATGAGGLDAAPLYPVHPSLLPPLVRFFARYGQHERSLFGFLLSDEPFALRAFAAQAPTADAWYGVAEFYDYVRSTFGHQLGGRSHESHWLRISATIDSAGDLPDPERRVLKAIGLLNLIDAEDLLPTDRALAACLAPQSAAATERALASLHDRGLIFRRGDHGGYRLWPNTSVNLRSAFQRAVEELPSLDGVVAHVQPHLEPTPLLARRHYIESGTLRFFELRYVGLEAIGSSLEMPAAGDGLVICILADTEQEREAALAKASGAQFRDKPWIIVGVSHPLGALSAELLDLKRWEWVQTRTPELAQDPYGAAEVGRMIAVARRRLTDLLASRAGAAAGGEGVIWFRQGAKLSTPRGLVPELSHVCDELFPDAPRIANELLNRNSLSSAAAAARMRLIEGLFEASDRPEFGLDPKKAPPERSMYLSVMKRGGLHFEGPEGWRLCEPSPHNDPLKLRPAFAEILAAIDSRSGDPVPVDEILARLKPAPFGVRDGVAALLLAIILKLRSHELALFQDGTFLPRWGGAEFMRLLKQPSVFAIQPCRIEGVRADVFTRLAEVFSGDVSGREAQLLDVVAPLCRFAAGLPEYVRRAGALSRPAAAVRDALLNAREPATLVFRDLPRACGLEEFAAEGGADAARADTFVRALQNAVEELHTAYPRLLGRLTQHITEAMKLRRFDRGEIATRAARVSLAAREPRLRTFALRLRDPKLNDEAWLEALGAYVLSRPPKRWGPADEAQFTDLVGELAETFHRVEATAFSGGKARPAETAIRLNLTRADGTDRVHVLHPAPLEPRNRAKLDILRGELPRDAGLRLQMLSELLWEELAGVATETSILDELNLPSDGSAEA